MKTVIHFEFRELDRWGNGFKRIGCGTRAPDSKAVNLDRVTCGRCKRSRSYKAYRAFVLGLIDKKMLREIGLGLSGKLA